MKTRMTSSQSQSVRQHILKMKNRVCLQFVDFIKKIKPVEIFQNVSK